MTEKKQKEKEGWARPVGINRRSGTCDTNPGANSKAGVGDVSVATTGNGLRMLGTDQLQAGRFSRDKILMRMS